MKKIIFSLLLSVIAVVATAQVKGFGYGPRVGVNFADYLNSTGSARTGLQAGAFVDYNFTHRWGIETGAYYSQLGSTNNVELETFTANATHKFDYLTVPLLAKFNFLGGFRAIIGLEGMFLVSAKRKEQAGNTTNIQNLRPANLAFSIGAGYLTRYGLDITASYSKGFYSIQKNHTKGGNPYYFQVSIGWRFIGTNK